eukprot:tig00020603_g11813.t1
MASKSLRFLLGAVLVAFALAIGLGPVPVAAQGQSQVRQCSSVGAGDELARLCECSAPGGADFVLRVTAATNETLLTRTAKGQLQAMVNFVASGNASASVAGLEILAVLTGSAPAPNARLCVMLRPAAGAGAALPAPAELLPAFSSQSGADGVGSDVPSLVSRSLLEAAGLELDPAPAGASTPTAASFLQLAAFARPPVAVYDGSPSPSPSGRLLRFDAEFAPLAARALQPVGLPAPLLHSATFALAYTLAGGMPAAVELAAGVDVAGQRVELSMATASGGSGAGAGLFHLCHVFAEGSPPSLSAAFAQFAAGQSLDAALDAGIPVAVLSDSVRDGASSLPLARLCLVLSGGHSPAAHVDLEARLGEGQPAPAVPGFPCASFQCRSLVIAVVLAASALPAASTACGLALTLRVDSVDYASSSGSVRPLPATASGFSLDALFSGSGGPSIRRALEVCKAADPLDAPAARVRFECASASGPSSVSFHAAASAAASGPLLAGRLRLESSGVAFGADSASARLSASHTVALVALGGSGSVLEQRYALRSCTLRRADFSPGAGEGDREPWVGACAASVWDSVSLNVFLSAFDAAAAQAIPLGPSLPQLNDTAGYAVKAVSFGVDAATGELLYVRADTGTGPSLGAGSSSVPSYAVLPRAVVLSRLAAQVLLEFEGGAGGALTNSTYALSGWAAVGVGAGLAMEGPVDIRRAHGSVASRGVARLAPTSGAGQGATVGDLVELLASAASHAGPTDPPVPPELLAAVDSALARPAAVLELVFGLSGIDRASVAFAPSAPTARLLAGPTGTTLDLAISAAYVDVHFPQDAAALAVRFSLAANLSFSAPAAGASAVGSCSFAGLPTLVFHGACTLDQPLSPAQLLSALGSPPLADPAPSSGAAACADVSSKSVSALSFAWGEAGGGGFLRHVAGLARCPAPAPRRPFLSGLSASESVALLLPLADGGSAASARWLSSHDASFNFSSAVSASVNVTRSARAAVTVWHPSADAAAVTAALSFDSKVSLSGLLSILRCPAACVLEGVTSTTLASAWETQEAWLVWANAAGADAPALYARFALSSALDLAPGLARLENVTMHALIDPLCGVRLAYDGEFVLGGAHGHRARGSAWSSGSAPPAAFLSSPLSPREVFALLGGTLDFDPRGDGPPALRAAMNATSERVALLWGAADASWAAEAGEAQVQAALTSRFEFDALSLVAAGSANLVGFMGVPAPTVGGATQPPFELPSAPAALAPSLEIAAFVANQTFPQFVGLAANREYLYGLLFAESLPRLRAPGTPAAADLSAISPALASASKCVASAAAAGKLELRWVRSDVALPAAVDLSGQPAVCSGSGAGVLADVSYYASLNASRVGAPQAFVRAATCLADASDCAAATSTGDTTVQMAGESTAFWTGPMSSSLQRALTAFGLAGLSSEAEPDRAACAALDWALPPFVQASLEGSAVCSCEPRSVRGKVESGALVNVTFACGVSSFGLVENAAEFEPSGAISLFFYASGGPTVAFALQGTLTFGILPLGPIATWRVPFAFAGETPDPRTGVSAWSGVGSYARDDTSAPYMWLATVALDIVSPSSLDDVFNLPSDLPGTGLYTWVQEVRLNFSDGNCHARPSLNALALSTGTSIPTFSWPGVLQIVEIKQTHSFGLAPANEEPDINAESNAATDELESMFPDNRDREKWKARDTVWEQIFANLLGESGPPAPSCTEALAPEASASDTVALDGSFSVSFSAIAVLAGTVPVQISISRARDETFHAEVDLGGAGMSVETLRAAMPGASISPSDSISSQCSYTSASVGSLLLDWNATRLERASILVDAQWTKNCSFAVIGDAFRLSRFFVRVDLVLEWPPSSLETKANDTIANTTTAATASISAALNVTCTANRTAFTSSPAARNASSAYVPNVQLGDLGIQAFARMELLADRVFAVVGFRKQPGGCVQAAVSVRGLSLSSVVGYMKGSASGSDLATERVPSQLPFARIVAALTLRRLSFAYGCSPKLDNATAVDFFIDASVDYQVVSPLIEGLPIFLRMDRLAVQIRWYGNRTWKSGLDFSAALIIAGRLSNNIYVNLTISGMLKRDIDTGNFTYLHRIEADAGDSPAMAGSVRAGDLLRALGVGASTVDSLVRMDGTSFPQRALLESLTIGGLNIEWRRGEGEDYVSDLHPTVFIPRNMGPFPLVTAGGVNYLSLVDLNVTFDVFFEKGRLLGVGVAALCTLRIAGKIDIELLLKRDPPFISSDGWYGRASLTGSGGAGVLSLCDLEDLFGGSQFDIPLGFPTEAYLCNLGIRTIDVVFASSRIANISVVAGRSLTGAVGLPTEWVAPDALNAVHVDGIDLIWSSGGLGSLSMQVSWDQPLGISNIFELRDTKIHLIVGFPASVSNINFTLFSTLVISAGAGPSLTVDVVIEKGAPNSYYSMFASVDVSDAGAPLSLRTLANALGFDNAYLASAGVDGAWLDVAIKQLQLGWSREASRQFLSKVVLGLEFTGGVGVGGVFNLDITGGKPQIEIDIDANGKSRLVFRVRATWRFGGTTIDLEITQKGSEFVMVGSLNELSLGTVLDGLGAIVGSTLDIDANFRDIVGSLAEAKLTNINLGIAYKKSGPVFAFSAGVQNFGALQDFVLRVQLLYGKTGGRYAFLFALALQVPRLQEFIQETLKIGLDADALAVLGSGKIGLMVATQDVDLSSVKDVVVDVDALPSVAGLTIPRGFVLVFEITGSTGGNALQTLISDAGLPRITILASVSDQGVRFRAILGDIPIRGLLLQNAALGIDILVSGVSVLVEAKLRLPLDGKYLYLYGKVGIQFIPTPAFEFAFGLDATESVWTQALGIRFLSVYYFFFRTKIELATGIPVPSLLEIAADVVIGKVENCFDSTGKKLRTVLPPRKCILFSGAIGMNLVDWREFYAYVSASSVTLGSILGAVFDVDTSSWPDFIANTGFPNGLYFSYALVSGKTAVKQGEIVPIPPGIFLKGTVNILGFEAHAEVAVSWIMPNVSAFAKLEISVESTLGLFSRVFEGFSNWLDGVSNTLKALDLPCVSFDVDIEEADFLAGRVTLRTCVNVHALEGSTYRSPNRHLLSSTVATSSGNVRSISDRPLVIDTKDKEGETRRIGKEMFGVAAGDRAADALTNLNETAIPVYGPLLVLSSAWPAAVRFACDGGLKAALKSSSDSATRALKSAAKADNCRRGFAVWFEDDWGTVQTITVQDQTGPVWITSVPLDLSVKCGEMYAPPVVAAGDECQPTIAPTLSFSTNKRSVVGCQTQTYFNTWHARDSCGNLSPPLTQTVRIDDSEAPFYTTFPRDFTVAFLDPFGTARTGFPRAVDACASNGVGIWYEDAVTLPMGPACPFSRLLTRTWRAADSCGNVREKPQRISMPFPASLLGAASGFQVVATSGVLSIRDSTLSGRVAGGGRITRLMNTRIEAGPCSGPDSLGPIVAKATLILVDVAVANGTAAGAAAIYGTAQYSRALRGLSLAYRPGAADHAGMARSLEALSDRLAAAGAADLAAGQQRALCYDPAVGGGDAASCAPVEWAAPTAFNATAANATLRGTNPILNVFSFADPAALVDVAAPLAIHAPPGSLVVVNVAGAALEGLLRPVRLATPGLAPGSVVFNFPEAQRLQLATRSGEALPGTLLAPRAVFATRGFALEGQLLAAAVGPADNLRASCAPSVLSQACPA